MKTYLYIAAVLVIVCAFAALGNLIYRAGQNSVRVEVQAVVNAARKNEANAIERLDNAKRERAVVYRDRLNVITASAADSDVMRSRLPDAVVNQLRTERRP